MEENENAQKNRKKNEEEMEEKKEEKEEEEEEEKKEVREEEKDEKEEKEEHREKEKKENFEGDEQNLSPVQLLKTRTFYQVTDLTKMCFVARRRIFQTNYYCLLIQKYRFSPNLFETGEIISSISFISNHFWFL